VAGGLGSPPDVVPAAGACWPVTAQVEQKTTAQTIEKTEKIGCQTNNFIQGFLLNTDMNDLERGGFEAILRKRKFFQSCPNFD
jgi:hypothetical protein